MGEGVASQVYQGGVMVQDGHARFSREGGLQENDQSEVFEDKFKRDGRVSFMLEGETNQVDRKACMVADLVVKIDPTLGGRSNFLTKREF